MVPFGEDVVVPVTLRLSIITWVNADASESADKRLLERAMPGRGLLHEVATKVHTVVERLVERQSVSRRRARFWRGTTSRHIETSNRLLVNGI